MRYWQLLAVSLLAVLSCSSAVRAQASRATVPVGGTAMAVAFNPMFQSVCDSIVDAFVLRAQSVYR